MLSFEVENSSSIAKTVELTIRPKLDASGQPLPCNFRVPCSVIPCEVYTHTSRFILHLTKLDPEIQEWGQFEWSFRVREKNVNPYQSSGYAGTGAGGSYATGDYGGAGETGAGDDDMAGASSQEKACPACTFINPATAAFCEMCSGGL